MTTTREFEGNLNLFERAPVAIWHEDFSAIKLFLDSLPVSAGQLRGYLTGNPDAVRECTRLLRVVRVNRLARDFYGAASEEQLVQRLPDLFDGNSLEVFREELAALAEGKTTFEAEVATRTLRGEPRIVQMNVSVVPSTDAPWSQVIVAFIDITERKRLERDLIQSQKMESLGRLAGGLAHDLNNALTIINGYSDMLLEEIEPGASFYPNIQEIKRAGQRAAALIQQLLAFSRKQVLQPKIVNLNAIVNDAKSVLRTATGEHIAISLLLDPTLQPTRVDPAQFYHVLLNLVLNARDAMPDGGKLEIRTANVQVAEEERPGLLAGEYVTLTVADSGTGMDEETRTRLFEPFFTTKQSGRGTGLGLSSALGIAQQSGGTITVDSEPGRGSSFCVYLPTTHNGDEEAPARPKVRDLRGNETILVVEDEPEVRMLLIEALRRYGYGVLASGTPSEAIELFHAHGDSVRLVITDVVMPGMTGPQLIDTLWSRAPELKVVYISGYGNTPGVRRHVGESNVAYLEKPFGADALASAVRELLGGEHK